MYIASRLTEADIFSVIILIRGVYGKHLLTWSAFPKSILSLSRLENHCHQWSLLLLLKNATLVNRLWKANSRKV